MRTCGGGECQSERACSYCNTCLHILVKEKTPKNQWHRKLNRLFKYQKQAVCDFLDNCKSCQHGKCSQKMFIDSIINYTSKQPVFKYNHPVHGVITALLKPDGTGKEWKHKFKILMRYGCCQQCRSKDNLTIDHIIEISKGGSKRGYHNLTVLCSECNQKKSNPDYKKYKLKLSPQP